MAGCFFVCAKTNLAYSDPVDSTWTCSVMATITAPYTARTMHAIVWCQLRLQLPHLTQREQCTPLFGVSYGYNYHTLHSTNNARHCLVSVTVTITTPYTARTMHAIVWCQLPLQLPHLTQHEQCTPLFGVSYGYNYHTLHSTNNARHCLGSVPTQDKAAKKNHVFTSLQCTRSSNPLERAIKYSP